MKITDATTGEEIFAWLHRSDLTLQEIETPTRCTCCDQAVGHSRMVRLVHLPTATPAVGGGETFAEALNRAIATMERINVHPMANANRPQIG